MTALSGACPLNLMTDAGWRDLSAIQQSAEDTKIDGRSSAGADC